MIRKREREKKCNRRKSADPIFLFPLSFVSFDCVFFSFKGKDYNNKKISGVYRIDAYILSLSQIIGKEEEKQKRELLDSGVCSTLSKILSESLIFFGLKSIKSLK